MSTAKLLMHPMPGLQPVLESLANNPATDPGCLGLYACKGPDETPVFIIRGEDGYRRCLTPIAMEAWAKVYSVQTDAQREAATVGSMFGWHVPGAQAARLARPTPIGN